MTIANLVAEYASKKAEADRLYTEVKHLEAALIMALKNEYPDEWNRWERGVAALKAEGVTIPVTRTWDADKVLAVIGEERPDIVTEETKVVRKVDGRAMASLMKDAAYARRLEGCLQPQLPKVRLG